MRKRCYRSTAVKQANISKVLNDLAPGRVTVGLDIGKVEVSCVVRDATGHFERPWKVQNPSEIPLLVGKGRRLHARDGQVTSRAASAHRSR